MSRLYRVLFKAYHYIASPALHLWTGFGFGCRFQPTCSHYAYDALREHGVLRGGFIALHRFSRCHPFSSAPFQDPVLRKQDL